MLKIDDCYFFRTVTYHLVGRITAWVADSGRFFQAIKTGILAEVEPVGVAYVNLETVTDIFPWAHVLPDEVK